MQTLRICREARIRSQLYQPRCWQHQQDTHHHWRDSGTPCCFPIGGRLNLGAQKLDLVSLVVGQGILLLFAGMILGVSAAIGLTRLMASMLFNVHPNDPVTFAGVAVMLTLVALAACLIPACRPMSIDPILALRNE
jgi:hypothetical protein